MAEWKAQINFNYSPSFHSYSYSFLCQGTDQNQANNMSPWVEPELADLCDDFSPGEDDFPPAAAEPINPEVELSPPQQPPSPEQHAQLYGSDFDPYQLVYFNETEAEGLIMPGQARENDGRRAGSESASDSEPQTSPDSWSSGSGGDVVLPQADPVLWALKTSLDDPTMRTSPDSTESNSFVADEAQSYMVLGNGGVHNPTIPPEEAAATAPKTLSTKGKCRAAFSEAQMNVLTQRFNVQRYLTPAEMKNMAEHTGLTYKQVKTWFQNRRMKLRRHQKDNSWASERYNSLNKDIAAFPTLPSHMQPYQGPARPALKDHRSPHMFEAALKSPQNMALYLAAVGGANGAAGFPIWPNNAAQTPVLARPPVPGWPLPLEAAQYGFNARFQQSFSSSGGFKEGEQVIRGSPGSVFVQNAAQ